MTRNNTLGIAKSVILKRNARYMVITNDDTEDGIVNSASGILKDWDYGTTKCNRQIVVCAWLLFDDESIGQNARKRYHKKHTDIRLVPIICVNKSFSIGKNQKKLVVRMQLPIVEAEAITIHKSQGASYENVIVHIPYHKECAMIYVACSRATSSKGLKIVGTFPRRLTANPKVVEEMKIQREEKLLKLKFSSLLENKIICGSFNIRSMKKHCAEIINDPCFVNSNLLFFLETGLLENETVKIPNMQEKSRVPATSRNRKCGVSCFVNDSIFNQIQNSFKNKIVREHGHCEYVHVKIENINYFGVYVSPKFPFKLFLEEFRNLLFNIKKEQCVIIGDFNTNLNEISNEIKSNFGDEFKIGINASTTNYNSCLDNVVSNIDFSAIVYESLTSDHRPILVTEPLMKTKVVTRSKPTISNKIVILQNIIVQPPILNFNKPTINSSINISIPLNDPSDKQMTAINYEMQLLDQLAETIQDLLWNCYVLIVNQNFQNDFDHLKGKKAYDYELIHSDIPWQAYILSLVEIVENVVNVLRKKIVAHSNDRLSKAENEIAAELPKGLKEVYNLIRTTGDGSCFFHATSLSLFHIEKYSEILRFCALFHLVKFKDKLQGFLFDDEGYLSEAKCLSLTPKLCKTLRIENIACYADASVPLLMSEILRRPVLVIQGDRRNFIFQNCKTFSQLSTKILEQGNDHCFASLVARNDDTSKEPLVLLLFAHHYTAVLKKRNEQRYLPVVKYNVLLNFDP